MFICRCSSRRHLVPFIPFSQNNLYLWVVLEPRTDQLRWKSWSDFALDGDSPTHGGDGLAFDV